MKKALALLVLVGCAPQMRPKPTAPTPPVPSTTPAATAAPTPALPKGFAFFYVPQPEGDLGQICDVLKSNPRLRPTIIFPPRYFELASHRDFIDKMRVLQSSGQVEIALTLDNEPNLPLLADVTQAGGEITRGGVEFAYPEDIGAQIAKGSGMYQKRWAMQPHGLYPPHFAISKTFMESLHRFRLHWAIAQPRAEGGAKFFGNTALFVPWPAPADGEEMVVDRPFLFADGSQGKDPKVEIAFLKKMSKLFPDIEGSPPMSLAWELAESLDHDTVPEGTDPLVTDFSAWSRIPAQRLAWQALADARKVVETYKNSGRASLPRLDAAMEEIYSAESGTFLLALGQTEVPLTLNERNFIATLSNVYRLCAIPIPPNLPHWFSDRNLQRTGSRSDAGGRPFFVTSGQSMTWNDPINDDTGDGSYLYPVGHYPKGAFDLNRFSISWTDTDVTFTMATTAKPDLQSAAAIPVVDVYIDVNRLSGAGGVSVLSGRGSMCLVDRDAAWEYALTFSPKDAAIYQSVPGGAPRKLRDADVNASGGVTAVTVSRNVLRGEPSQWRLSVGLAAATNAARDPEPVSVLVNPTDKNFGGAMPGRQAPPYVDLLAPSSDDQFQRMRDYRDGRRVVLPYVPD